MRPSTLERVKGVIVKAAGLGPDQRLDEATALIGGGLSLDSVAVLQILVGLEEEFGIEVSADELLRAQAVQTVGALASFIDSKLGAVR